MDRFKCRGRRVDNGEWVYGDLVRSTTKIKTSDSDEPFSDCWIAPRCDIDINFILGGSEHSLHTKAFIVIPETVGQCTGLLDRKGKLIYEGDRVRYYWVAPIDHGGKEYEEFTIAWNGYKFKLQHDIEWKYSVQDWIVQADSIEVIGTIHKEA